MKMKLSSLLIHTSPLTARQERTSLLFCWGPGVLRRQPADGWLQAGNSPPPFFLSFGSRRGFCGSGDEAPGAGLGDASLWRMRHSPTGCDKGSSVNEKDTGLLIQTKKGFKFRIVAPTLYGLSLHFLTVRGQGQDLPPASEKGCATQLRHYYVESAWLMVDARLKAFVFLLSVSHRS